MPFRLLLAILFMLATTTATLAQTKEGPPLRTAVDGTFAPHAMPKLGGGLKVSRSTCSLRSRAACTAPSLSILPASAA